MLAQRHDLPGIVAEHEGDRGDRAGLDDGAAGPAEQHGDGLAERPRQEMILAAGVRIAGRQFGIAERADQRDDAAEQPDADERGLAGHIGGDQRRRLENADAEHDAHHHGDGMHRAQIWARCRALYVGHVGLLDACGEKRRDALAGW